MTVSPLTPGDMMATNPRWCQPVKVWRKYFEGWIAKPNPEAQMLASVVFDLRPIGGDVSLFKKLQKKIAADKVRLLCLAAGREWW